MLTEFNVALGSIIPAVWWDAMQLVLGLLCIALVLVERRVVPRAQTHSTLHACVIKWWAVRASQAGQAIIGSMAVLIVMDALTDPPSPPRALVVAYLFASSLKMFGSIHFAWERRKSSHIATSRL